MNDFDVSPEAASGERWRSFFRSHCVLTLLATLVLTALSAPIARAGVAHLAFTTQPGNATATQNFGIMPTVKAYRADGSVDTSFNGVFSISAKTGTGGVGALFGSTGVLVSNGSYTWNSLGIAMPGRGYVLTVTATGYGSVDSNPFTVAWVPMDLWIDQQPSNAQPGIAFGTQPKVRVRDIFWQTAEDYTGPITLALKPGSGTPGAVLSGMKTVNPVNGIATFTNLSIDKAGTGYVLIATCGTLAATETYGFAVAKPAKALRFSIQPRDAKAGAAFYTQPQVETIDEDGNRVGNTDDPIAVSIKSGTGAAGAVLIGYNTNYDVVTGTMTADVWDGVADYYDTVIDKAGMNYVLVAECGTLSSAESAPFHVSFAGAPAIGATGPCASADGTIYYGSADGVLYGVQASDGAEVVNVDTKALAGDANANRKLLGRPSRRPWSGEDAVFCVTDDNRLVVVGTDGTVKMVKTLPGSGTSVDAIVMVQDDVAYVAATNGTDTMLSKVDAAGNVASQGLVGANPSAISVYGSSLFVGTNAGVYRVQAGSFIVGLCFGGPTTGSPFISNTANAVYAVSDDGKVYACSAATGSAMTSFGTNGVVDLGITVASGPKVKASLFAYNGKLYIGGMDNKVYCLNTGTGAGAAPGGGRVFYDAGAGGSITGGVGVSPFGHTCLVFGSTNGSFHQVSLSDPSTNQAIDLKSPINTAPAVDRATQTVCITTEDGHVYRLPAF